MIQKVAVYCMLIYENKILLLERKEPNVFEFPGGGIEFGEHPKQAILREIEEETGIKISPQNLKLLCVSSCVYPSGKEQQIVILYYSRLSEKPEIKLSAEHLDYKWIKGNELEKFKNLALSVKSCLNEIKKIFLSFLFLDEG